MLLTALICIALGALVLALAFFTSAKERPHQLDESERRALERMRNAPELTLAQRKRIAEVLAATNDDGEKLR